jgi:hypothetical protein
MGLKDVFKKIVKQQVEKNKKKKSEESEEVPQDVEVSGGWRLEA